MRRVWCFYIIGIAIVISCLLSSCSQKCFNCGRKHADLDVEIFPVEQNIMDGCEQRYNEEQLDEIVQFGGRLDELLENYPMACVRRIDSGYRTAYLGEASVAVLIFDDCGVCLFASVHKTSKMRSDFESIAPGQFVDDVRNFDPDGQFLFLYTGRNDSPKESAHYTKDGYMVIIRYNASHIVENVTFELI